jgi:hypothetical protein
MREQVGKSDHILEPSDEEIFYALGNVLKRCRGTQAAPDRERLPASH